MMMHGLANPIKMNHNRTQAILTDVIRGFPPACRENSERRTFKFATTFSSVIFFTVRQK
jgi:hypothetical protein